MRRVQGGRWQCGGVAAQPEEVASGGRRGRRGRKVAQNAWQRVAVGRPNAPRAVEPRQVGGGRVVRARMCAGACVVRWGGVVRACRARSAVWCGGVGGARQGVWGWQAGVCKRVRPKRRCATQTCKPVCVCVVCVCSATVGNTACVVCGVCVSNL